MRLALRVSVALIATLCWVSTGGAQQPPNPNLEFGNPGGGCSILDKRFFVICYDTGRRIPEWVSYRLRGSDLQNAQTRTEDFRPDEALDDDARSALRDYRSSGFDRGHMAPAADFTRSERAMSTTFLLSNMTPQRPRLNRGIWANLESEVRDLAREFGSIWIFTGSLFLDELPPGHRRTIGNGRVAVPTHIYKVILAPDSDKQFEAFAFVLPNSLNPIRNPITEFEETVDEVWT